MLRNINITAEMVKKKLKDLNINKSTGPDDIHPQLLSELADLMSKPLSLLLNVSIKNSTIPGEWKSANIVPVFKKGSKSLPENYRPISLTCVICRIMESFIKDAIMEHLVSNNLLSYKRTWFHCTAPRHNGSGVRF